uniref:CWC15 spliceosome associated protein homolog n=1 Tax=Junco hyemalis TaxID=40217 RepID=A0A8C5JTA8_JUNHY
MMFVDVCQDTGIGLLENRIFQPSEMQTDVTILFRRNLSRLFSSIQEPPGGAGLCGVAGLCVQCTHTQEGSAEERINIYVHGTQFLFPVLTCSAQDLVASMKNLSPAAECQTPGFLPVCCFRQTTQDAPEEVRNRDFRRELEERERVAAREKNRDRPTREHTTSSSVSKKPRLDQIPAANLDADDPLTDEDDEDEDLEDSDDDDTAALLAELEKIKKERAEEQARKEQEQKAEEERIRMENILSGNPLLNLTGPAQPQANFKVKRRWDDDVVFKNCAKGIDETKKDKRFVNDTLRSEFHKKFMEKYIK